MNDPATDEERGLLVIADAIHTVAGRTPVRALLARRGRVVATGDRDALERRDPDAEVLDLRGTTVTPGLTDAHVHLTEWAFARREVDVSAAASPAAAAHAVTAHLKATKGSAAGGWLRGRGWNPHLWHDAAPHRSLLDEAVGDRPVVLQSHDMHALWASTAALRAAGIDAATPDPEGGHIVRDERGQPTGLLLEWAGRRVMDAMPLPAPADMIDAVRDAQAELHSLGITGVHSFPGVHLVEPDPLPVLLTMRERGELRLRVLQLLRAERLDDAARLGLRSGFGDETLRIGPVKMFLDGALGSRTAWMREPYVGTDDCGMRTLEPDAFREIVARAAAAGIASAVHAIGDAAVCLALDVLAEPGLRVPSMPHRIEHIQCCPVERLADAAAAGIVCSMQPAHIITDWRIADRHWGAERNQGAFAAGSLERLGSILAFGSDVPVEPVDPRRGLYAAIMRQDFAGQPPGGWVPGERMAPLAALRGYTVGPARAAGLAEPAGSLGAGAPADFVAWDRDPISDPASIPHMRCVAAAIGGQLVFQA